MNQFDLKKSFRIYLKETRGLSSVTIKNYLSDLSYFVDWNRKLGLNSQFYTQKDDFYPENISSSLLANFKKHLLSEKMAKSTTKRRLATIRIFCQFCQDQNFLSTNPGLDLRNPQKTTHYEETNELLSKFGSFLKKQGSSKNTIKNYVADVRNYLQWANC